MIEGLEIVDSARAFASAVRTLREAGATEAYVKRVGGKNLVIAASRAAVAEYVGVATIPLPEPKQAEEWWSRLLRSEIVDFRFFDDGLNSVACLAKSGVWEGVPQILMAIDKDRFMVLEESQFRSIVGSKAYDEMLKECFVLGLSIRCVEKVSEEAKRIGELRTAASSRLNRRKASTIGE